MIRIILSALALLIAVQPVYGDQMQQHETMKFDISQTVVKMRVDEGVAVNDVITFLQSKAAELNMKIVAHQPVSKELKARGIESGPLHIFQFCNPGDAHKMVSHNPIFAAYMPCRIALVEDNEGQLWLMMMDLNILINNAPLTPELRTMAERINSDLMKIMEAGASASF